MESKKKIVKKPSKSLFKQPVKITKTASEQIPEKGKPTKLLLAEKEILEGRLAEVNNLLKEFEDTPGLEKATDLMLNQFGTE